MQLRGTKRETPGWAAARRLELSGRILDKTTCPRTYIKELLPWFVFFSAKSGPFYRKLMLPRGCVPQEAAILYMFCLGTVSLILLLS
jgi:hypothetical protein